MEGKPMVEGISNIHVNQQSESLDKLLPELMNVHGILDDIKPSKKNGFFNSDYVPLNKLIEITKPILRKCNLLIGNAILIYIILFFQFKS